ncbi:hypothetical protein GCM10009530_41600 [Microbispora corallina]|uniref:DUF998 domain-containing protein n=1 Tax=Microbispora corallina TaxID=83302 RepID=A0ABQ4G1I3_9ACTN|nr:DUF6069 family protein [Microbispora corallina]GIH40911.1 hypothetical protein Mco01_39110 [Microbispora corallina]
MASDLTTSPNSTRSRTAWGLRLLAVLGSVAAALAVWAVAGPVAGVDLRASAGTGVQNVGAVAVAVTSALCGLLALALIALLERNVPRPRAAWLVIAAAVFAVSLTGPLGGVTGGAKAALACMHLAVAAVLIGGLTGTVRRTGRDR